MARMSDSLSRFTQPSAAKSLTVENEDSLLDGGPTSEFDSAEIIAGDDEDEDSAERSSEGLFYDAEDCGPKVHEGVAKGINSVWTMKPAEAVLCYSKEILSPRKL